MSAFVISLDFELFWGVAGFQSIAAYRNHVEGEWQAIPQMLMLFRRYGIRATWATVGMVMCRDYAQWREVRPSVLPGYRQQKRSTYRHDRDAREYPKLFFARPLVERILETPGQELGSHTYSHFYCGEEGASPGQFAADMECAALIASDMSVRWQSIVLPRNQIVDAYLDTLDGTGIRVFRGNQDHWLYRAGDAAPGAVVGRAARLLDTWLPLSGRCVARPMPVAAGLTNLPASLFLRPWCRQLAALDPLRLARMKSSMTAAALSGGVCHLWWHPHNFGTNLEQNLVVLEALLRHFAILRELYGMSSACMRDFIADGRAENPLPARQEELFRAPTAGERNGTNVIERCPAFRRHSCIPSSGEVC